VEGPTIVAEEKGVIEEPEPVSIRKRTLYRYRMEQCTAVDFNDLTEDQFFILCHEKDGVKTAYIWKGEQFDISEVIRVFHKLNPFRKMKKHMLEKY